MFKLVILSLFYSQEWMENASHEDHMIIIIIFFFLRIRAPDLF